MKAISCAMIVGLGVVSTMTFAEIVAAAEIVSIKGEIRVNAGSGYRSVTEGTVVNVGDAVIASPGAQASLVYADGCTVQLVPGMVAWIEQTSPCAPATGRTGDPDPALVAPKVFDRAWLFDGAASIKRSRTPAGP